MDERKKTHNKVSLRSFLDLQAAGTVLVRVSHTF